MVQSGFGGWVELEGTERSEEEQLNMSLERFQGRSHRTRLKNEHFPGDIGSYEQGGEGK